MNPRTSLIVAFYEKIDYLRLVLAGFERQSFTDFEIIIADDGSDQSTIKNIEQIIINSGLSIKHIWHPDIGWRKNKILNLSIQASASDYIIFIDGDCVPHGEFVSEHYLNRKKNTALTGRRVNLSEKFTEGLTTGFVRAGKLDRSIFRLIIDGLFGKSFDVEKGFYFESRYLRNYFNRKKRGLLGCNFSIHKEDLLRLNGFDERYEAPAIGEDTDIQYRFELIGGRIVPLNNIAVQYHLYHPIKFREKKNLELFDLIKAEGKSYTPFGILKS